MTHIDELLIKEFPIFDREVYLKDALDRLRSYEVSLGVVVSEGRIFATISQGDLLRALLKGAALNERAINYAAKNPIYIKGYRSLDYIIKIMVENNIKRVPLCSEDGAPIGIITQDIVIDYFSKEQNLEPIKAINIVGAKHVYSVDEDTKVSEIARLMIEHSIGVLPVSDKRGFPIGVVSENDVLEDYEKYNELLAKDIMSSPPVTADELKSIEEIIHTLKINNIRHILITAKSGELIGVISKRDILRNLKNSYIARLEKRNRYIKTAFDFFDQPILEIIRSEDEFIIKWNNNAASELFGEDIRECDVKDVFPQRLWETLGRDIKNVEIKNIKINERIFDFRLKAIGEDEYIAFFHEMTETLKYEQMLKDTNRLLEEEIQKRTWELVEANDEINRSKDMLEEAHKVAKLSNWRYIVQGERFEFYRDIENLVDGLKTDMTQEELIKVFDKRDVAEFMSKIEACIDFPQDFSMTLITKLGNKTIKLKGKPYHIEDEKVLVLFGTLQDISEERALEKKAGEDELTGIYNRRKFNDVCESEFRRFQRFHTTFCTIIFDIDRFKAVNDTFGHLEGDKVLKELTLLVSSHIRSIDVFARWGGEEFVILAIDEGVESAIVLAEKLRTIINTHDFGKVGRVSCSFGVAKIDSRGVKSMMERADEAMYEAKRGGRDKVCVDKESL